MADLAFPAQIRFYDALTAEGRATALERLEHFHSAFGRGTIDQASFRRFLDHTFGTLLFPDQGGRMHRLTNYLHTKASVRNALPRSEAVDALISSGTAPKEIDKASAFEHAIPIGTTIKALAEAGDYEAALRSYKVAYVTREEHKALDAHKSEPCRYEAAALRLIVPDTRFRLTA